MLGTVLLLVILPVALLSYLIGSMPFGLILVRLAGLGDVRRVGSGNIGATNVLRAGGKVLGAATLLLDALKGTIAVLIGALGGPWFFMEAFAEGRNSFAVAPLAGVAAVFVVLGHCHPVWLRFRGGKGVATALGAFLALGWPIFVTAGLTWLILAKATRMSSASGLGGMVAAAAVSWLMPELAVSIAVTLIVLYVVARHHGNIRRLLAGTEPRIGEGK